MKRGDVVSVAWTGDFGKPRPAVVIQSDVLDDGDTVLICQMTSTLQSASLRRVTVIPDETNGLLKPSQIMAEKIFAVKRVKIGAHIGRLDQAALGHLNEALAMVTGLLDPR